MRTFLHSVSGQAATVIALMTLFACGGGKARPRPVCADPIACSEIVMRNSNTCQPLFGKPPQEGRVLNRHPNRSLVVSGTEYRRPLNSPTPETQKPWVRIVKPLSEVLLGCEYLRENDEQTYLFQWAITIGCFEDDCPGTELPDVPPPLRERPREGDCAQCSGPLCILIDPRSFPGVQQAVFNELEKIAAQIVASGGSNSITSTDFFAAVVKAGGDACDRQAIEIRGTDIRWPGSDCVIRIATGVAGTVDEFELELPQSVQGVININASARAALIHFADRNRAIQVRYFRAGTPVGGEYISRIEITPAHIRLSGSTHYCLTIRRPNG